MDTMTEVCQECGRSASTWRHGPGAAVSVTCGSTACEERAALHAFGLHDGCCQPLRRPLDWHTFWRPLLCIWASGVSLSIAGSYAIRGTWP